MAQPATPEIDLVPAAIPADQRKLVLDTTLVITLANLKGGVGKTTSTYFLACYFAMVHGLRVLVIDADPLSQTGYSWHRKTTKRGIRWPFDFQACHSTVVGDLLDDTLDAGTYDVILVDSGGESDAILKAAVARSHELIVVASTSDSEQERIPGTIDAAREAAANLDWDIEIRVLLTKVPTNDRGRDEKQTRDKLQAAGFPAFAACTHAWKHYYKSYDTTAPMDDLAEYYDIGEEIADAYYPEAA